MKQNKIRIRVAVLILQDNKVLLVQHCKNNRKYWLLPGGGLEFGETIESCALRELMEETNLEIELGDFLFMNESIPNDAHRHVINLYFEGQVTGGIMKLGDDEVLSDVQFISISELPGLPFYPNVKQELLDYLNESGKINQRSLGNRWE